MSEDMEKKREEIEARVEARARRIRHFGYVFFLAGTLYIAISLSVGVIQGIRNDQALDPFTEVPMAEHREFCEEWATSLMSIKSDDFTWHEMGRVWRWQCREGDGDHAAALWKSLEDDPS